MQDDGGKQPEKPRVRGEPLRIDLPFEDALRAAMEVKPEKAKPAKAKKGSGRSRASPEA